MADFTRVYPRDFDPFDVVRHSWHESVGFRSACLSTAAFRIFTSLGCSTSLETICIHFYNLHKPVYMAGKHSCLTPTPLTLSIRVAGVLTFECL